MPKTKQLPSELEIQVVHRVEVDPEFVGFLLDYPDIFGPDYIGYWAYGISLKPYGVRGWLVAEFESLEEECGPLSDEQIWNAYNGIEAEGREVVTEFCHLLDEEAAHRVIEAGVRTWMKPNFQQDYDGNTLDMALQVALLGSHTYV